MAGADFPPPRPRLGPGETLVVVSDGVTEASTPANANSTWRPSARSRRRTRRAPAAALATAIVDAVRSHRGADRPRTT